MTSKSALAAVAGALLSISAAATVTGRLWDEARLLSSRQRADLEKRLASATRRLGSPVFILLADARRPETVATLAARTFSERSLAGAAESNPVLLALSVRERAAAIETGKGNAGIVPEIDAHEITKRLLRGLSGGDPTQALVRAIDEIVASAQATAARRRPSPPEQDLPPQDATHMPVPTGGATESAAGAADGGSADGGSAIPEAAPEKQTPRGRSRLPIAVGIAALLLLVLALRRRRQLTVARRESDKRPDTTRRPQPPAKPPAKPPGR